MDGRFRCALIVCVVFLWPAAQSRADTACVEPAQLTHAGVSLTRHFDRGEAAEDGPGGIQGSGWFLNPTTIVTVAHVATAMHLSTQDWKELEVRDGDVILSVPARILRLVGLGTERLAVIELQTAVPSARSLALRLAPLAPEERVMTPAYAAGRLRVTFGRFVRYGDRDGLVGRAMLEMYDGNDRLAVDHGASGAPVLDCDGRVTAVVANVITQTLTLGRGDIRVSTAWGVPNVVSVPVQALQESSEAK